jgi:type I restriction enzyme S subunit
MNAEELLRHYERVADAPEAVTRLRHFVLDLAVRGKLADQCPAEEPVSELLGRIASEKARLTAAGLIRPQKPAPSLEKEPFRLPDNWRWTQLSQIGLISPRNDASDETLASFVPMTFIAAEYGVKHDHEIRPWGEIKKGYTHFANEDVGLAKITPCFENGKSTVFRGLSSAIGSGTTELHVVRPVLVSPDFIVLVLKSPYFIQAGIPRMTGTAGQKRVPAEYFAHSPFPLPPLAEQRRIVAKVDELLSLCDRLEAARAEREAARDQLAAASLARLNAPDPETFANDARFALDALPALTARPDQIKQLRQMILNLAVRGKLVPQHDDDQPASQLLSEIEENRRRLVAAKAVPKPKAIPRLDDLELPFALPSAWAWSLLGELCYQVSDGPHFSPQYVSPADGVPFLSTRNVQPGGFDLSGVKYVSRADHEQFCRRVRPEQGDIIYTKGGTTGIARVNDLDFEFSVWVHLAVLRIEKHLLYPRYVELALNSPHCYEQSQRYTQGTSNFDLGLTRMIKITVPLPPLPEQRRIVAKVDELMALCDRLGASLNHANEHRRRLIEAMLREVLEPTDEPDAVSA